MDVSGAAEAGVSVFVVLAGLVGLIGLVAAGWRGVEGRGRPLLLCGLGAAGVLVGLMGTMVSGYTLRVGGSGPRLMDAGDPAGGLGGSAGVALPLGSLLGLLLLVGLLLVAGTTLRRPLAVGAAGGGWLAMVAVLMFGTGSAGDVLVPNTTPAQIYVYGGFVVAFVIGVLVYQWQLTDQIAARAAGTRSVEKTSAVSKTAKPNTANKTSTASKTGKTNKTNKAGKAR